MAAENFWMYAADPRQQAAAAPAGMAAGQAAPQRPQVAPAMAPPPVPAGGPPLKRQRPDYFDMPSGQDMTGYFPHEQGRAGFHEAMGVSYGRYSFNEMPSVNASQTARAVGGMTGYPADDRHMMGVMGLDSRNMGSARTEPALPPDASNTLYIEGLPSNCTRREVSHIFRPFIGFHEVRLVNKESRHHGGDYHVLCFADFGTPAQALVALEALQGYKFDEHNRNSGNLRLQFSRFPGPRSGGGPHGRY